MDDDSAARALGRQQVRTAAENARLQARQTRRAVEQTRRRLRLQSLPLRALAMRRLLHDRGPDTPIWTGLALQPHDADASEARSPRAEIIVIRLDER